MCLRFIGFAILLHDYDIMAGTEALAWTVDFGTFQRYAPLTTAIMVPTFDFAESDTEKLHIHLSSVHSFEDFDAMRILEYQRADVFLLCYNVVDRDSFHNIATHWLPGIRQEAPETSFVLVGCNLDLRAGEVGTNETVSTAEGMRAAKTLGAAGFFECSAKEYRNIIPLMHFVAELLLKPDRTDNKCVVC